MREGARKRERDSKPLQKQSERERERKRERETANLYKNRVREREMREGVRKRVMQKYRQTKQIKRERTVKEKIGNLLPSLWPISNVLFQTTAFHNYNVFAQTKILPKHISQFKHHNFKILTYLLVPNLQSVLNCNLS